MERFYFLLSQMVFFLNAEHCTESAMSSGPVAVPNFIRLIASSSSVTFILSVQFTVTAIDFFASRFAFVY